MPRCGCSDRCTCKLIDGCGTKVSGDGNLSTKTPYKLDFEPGVEDACGCVKVMNCVGSNLAESGSLVYTPDDHELAVCISKQEGNLLGIGNDGCIFYDGSAPPPVNPCHRTVESLPGFAVGGVGGAGYNNSPWNTVRSYREAIDVKLDLTQLHPFILSDGTVAIAPFDWFGRPGWYSEPKAIDPPGSGDPVIYAKPFNQLTTAAWRSARIDYQKWVPSFGEVNTANWFETFADVLEYTMGNIVYVISIDGSHMDTSDHLERLRSRVVESLVRRCLQRSAIIYSRDPKRLLEAQAAGIDTGVYIDSGNVATVTPDVAAQSGAKWALTVNGPRQGTGLISWGQTKAYADKGLQTLAFGIMNRLDKDNAMDAGCRGFLGHDPVYAADDPERFHANRTDDWLFNGISPGQQAWRSANLGYFGYFGVCGIRMPDKWQDGWLIQKDSGYGTTSTLLGQYAPMPNEGKRYTVTWKFVFMSKPATTGKFLQLAFACENDVPALEKRTSTPNDPQYPAVFSGYLARFYTSGRIELYRVDKGVQSKPLAGQDGAPPSVGSYSSFTLTVTDTGIKLERTGTKAISVVDSIYRGHYMHMMKYGGDHDQDGGLSHLVVRA